MRADMHAQSPVIIVGGGLSGLSAAAILARAGHAVTVFEKASAPGGRARTKQHDGFFFNEGAQAFYLGGPGEQLLNELGVRAGGSPPDLKQFLVFDEGKLHAMPASIASLFKTTLLKFGAKAEFVRLYSMLQHIDPTQLQHVSLQDWLQQHVRHPQIRQLFLALARVTTFTNAPEMVSAGLVLPLLNARVRYLDGGWQTLVDGLRQVAQEAGAKIVTSARVAAIEISEEQHTVRLADGTSRPASVVLLAVDPQTASTLVAGGAHKELSSWAAQSVPLRVACLDVALRRLPVPQHLYVLGIDRPLYYSVHSAWARLAPEGSALIQTMKYLRPDEPAQPETSRRELEALLDAVQPGWRAEVVEQYFLPHLVASNALVQASQGGLSGRPGPAVPGIRNLYIAGDWVGAEDQLSNACFASAKNAATMIMTALAAQREDYVGSKI
jgi:phytoene dehydrogenase-like protein